MIKNIDELVKHKIDPFYAYIAYYYSEDEEPLEKMKVTNMRRMINACYNHNEDIMYVKHIDISIKGKIKNCVKMAYIIGFDYFEGCKFTKQFLDIINISYQHCYINVNISCENNYKFCVCLPYLDFLTSEFANVSVGLIHNNKMLQWEYTEYNEYCYFELIKDIINNGYNYDIIKNLVIYNEVLMNYLQQYKVYAKLAKFNETVFF